MSQIIINEQEQVGYNSFDATENIVLVPLFTTKTGVDSDRAQLFSTLKEFRAVYPDEEGAPKLNSEKDKSYFFIRELLNAGLKVVVKPFKSDTETANLSLKQLVNYRVGAGLFDEFGSKNLWNIKFITTGYWPNRFVSDEELEESSESSESSETPAAQDVGCYGTLIKLASDRNDCVAVIEFDDEDLEPEKFLKIINKEQAGDDYRYGVCSYPSIKVNLVTLAGTTIRKNDNIDVPTAMPAAFGYLMAFANSVRTNANWFAASGIIRGVIPNLVDVKYDVTDAQMEIMQDGPFEGTDTGDRDTCWKVNPIMRMGTYGIRLWGNRVIASGSNRGVPKLTFSDFLNVRMLLCDLKKQIYHAALRTTFEPNDDLTWVNFKSLCSRLLDQMQSGRGINWYSWRRVDVEEKATIKAVLTIKPIEAVEYFDITINLSDEEVAIGEMV